MFRSKSLTDLNSSIVKYDNGHNTSNNNNMNNNSLISNKYNLSRSMNISNNNLNNSQTLDILGSTLSLSNNRTKPKTSKEILQEISRLTNGTTPILKINDLDTSMSSNPSRTVHPLLFYNWSFQKYEK